MSVHIFDRADQLPPFPGDLEGFEAKDLAVRFGFKAVKIDDAWFWEPGTEQDFRESEAERLGIPPSEVDVDRQCWQAGPNQCYGGCLHGFCKFALNDATQLYYCTCVKV